MKYTNGQYTLTKSVLDSLRQKASDFILETRTRHAVHLTMATPYGLVPNTYSGEIPSQIVAEDLFQLA